MDTLISLGNAFMTIQNPRIDRTKKHNLSDIIMITLCATACGMEGWEDIEIFGTSQ
ncbi:MAG: transposase family protein [Desulfovibrionaceae bacterium]